MHVVPRSTTRVLAGLASIALSLTGCDRQRSKLDEPMAAPTAPGATAPGATAPGATAPGATAATPPAAGDDISGTVVETMRSGGYTYAKLDRGDKQIWVAGPETQLAIGTKLGKLTGTLMEGFHSSTLDRTFDQIYFVNALTVTGAAMPNPHGVAAATTQVEKIAPAPGGKAINDVFANKAALAGKQVVVRGKAVKVNNGILDRNWIHLQDGTGSTGTNDLLVTTAATVTRGDIVVARGTLAIDKDFGGGYRYDVVVENAEIASK